MVKPSLLFDLTFLPPIPIPIPIYHSTYLYNFLSQKSSPSTKTYTYSFLCILWNMNHEEKVTMDLVPPSDQHLCYVRCNFCNTVLAVCILHLWYSFIYQPSIIFNLLINFSVIHIILFNLKKKKIVSYTKFIDKFLVTRSTFFYWLHIWSLWNISNIINFLKICRLAYHARGC